MSLVKAPAGALAPVVISYVLAIAAAYGTLAILAIDPIWELLIADVVATVVIFAFSRAYDNSSFYDPYWSVAPPLLLLGWWELEPTHERPLLALAFVSAWAIRLTVNWLRSWDGLGHEDWRYVHFRGEWGRAYWLGSFGAIHLFPTAMTFLGSLPLFYAATTRTPFGALDVLAGLVTAAAIAIESIADRQLRDYRRTQESGSGGICDVGLWRYSRHPNYFGECLFWLGVFLFGIAASPAAWWTGIGFVAIVAMFVFGTIPMMERRSLARRPQYAEVQRRVSMLVPLPPHRE